MPFNFYETHTLLMAVQQLTPATTFLRDRYFPTNDASDVFATDDVLVEYRDGSKKLAPFVAPRKGGVTILRNGYHMERYTPPFVAPKRSLSADDLKKRGFDDIEVVVSGGYDPTETAENARIIRAQQKVYAQYGAQATLNPRLAGSWPGSVFTQPPVSIPAGQFGLGHGGGAHAPNEYMVIDSSNPKVQGYVGATMGFVDFLYEMAKID